MTKYIVVTIYPYRAEPVSTCLCEQCRSRSETTEPPV